MKGAIVDVSCDEGILCLHKSMAVAVPGYCRRSSSVRWRCSHSWSIAYSACRSGRSAKWPSACARSSLASRRPCAACKSCHVDDGAGADGSNTNFLFLVSGLVCREGPTPNAALVLSPPWSTSMFSSMGSLFFLWFECFAPLPVKAKTGTGSSIVRNAACSDWSPPIGWSIVRNALCSDDGPTGAIFRASVRLRFNRRR